MKDKKKLNRNLKICTGRNVSIDITLFLCVDIMGRGILFALVMRENSFKESQALRLNAR